VVTRDSDSSCYVTGSVAGGYMKFGASDLDLTIFSSIDTETIKSLLNMEEIDGLARELDLELDVTVVGKGIDLIGRQNTDIGIREAVWSAKLGGVLVWGTEVEFEFIDTSWGAYAGETSRAFLEFTRRAGYDQVSSDQENAAKLFELLVASSRTKLLVSLASWTSTVRLALLQSAKVGNKLESIQAMKLLDPVHAKELEVIFFRCRDFYSYKFPSSEAGRFEVAGYCHQVANRIRKVIRIAATGLGGTGE
jgi:hypothetical protein